MDEEEEYLNEYEREWEELGDPEEPNETSYGDK